MTVSSDMKPCPFCNGNVKLDIEYDMDGSPSWVIWCPGCGMQFTKTPWWGGYEESKIIEEWNRRIQNEAEKRMDCSTCKRVYSPTDSKCCGCRIMLPIFPNGVIERKYQYWERRVNE